MSDIQDFIGYIVKKLPTAETLPTIPPIHIYINKINDRRMLKIKDVYKLELQTPKTMQLLNGTKQLIDKTKNGENVTSLKVVEVVLV